MDTRLAQNIREAAREQGLKIEAFRTAHGFSNGTFYELLAGAAPRTVKVVQQLRAAGIAIPRSLLDSAA